MRILLEGDPEPASTEPRFVKEAYEGLLLEAFVFHASSQKGIDSYQRGYYTVPIGELLRKMKEHNKTAYEWLAKMWGPIVEIVDGTASFNGPFVIFRAERCFEVPKIVN